MPCCGGSKDKYSTFSDACFFGNIEKMRETLKAEAKKESIEKVVNKIDDSSDMRVTPLHRAAQKGKCEAIRFLLDHNADPRAISKTGETPLHVACFHRNKDAVAELLKSSAKQDVNTPEKEMGMTPLHVAVYRGCPEIVDMLIAAGADPSKKDKNGHDCLNQAEFWLQQEQDGMTSPQARHGATHKLLMQKVN